MVLAVELYQNIAERTFSPYGKLAWHKLKSFVDQRKSMTRDSYRFFVEHAYKQFLDHESFLHSAKSGTQARVVGTDVQGCSTKLEGDIWFEHKGHTRRIPKNLVVQGANIVIDDDEDEEMTDELGEVTVHEDMPSLEVNVSLPKEEKPTLGVSEDPFNPMDVDYDASGDEGVYSEQPEMTPQTGERPAIPVPASRVGELVGRTINLASLGPGKDLSLYGQHLMDALPEAQAGLLRGMVFSISQVELDDDDEEDERERPQTPDDVSMLSCLMMFDLVESTSHSEFMEIYPRLLQMNIDHDDFHVLQKQVKKVKSENPWETFRETLKIRPPSNPPGEEPTYKDIRDVEKEQKRCISMESDDDLLVDVAIQWFNMLNANQKSKVKQAIEVKVEPTEEKESSFKKEESKEKEPFVPPPEKRSQEKPENEPTTENEEQGEAKASSQKREEAKQSTAEEGDKASSFKKEEAKKDEAKEKEDSSKGERSKPQEEFYQQYDITGNEHTSVLRKLENCFAYPECEKWCGFYNKGFPCYPEHKHMFWHKKYRLFDPHQFPHKHSWHQEEENVMMAAYLSRHQEQCLAMELPELAKKLEYGCCDPRLHPRYELEVQNRTLAAKNKLNSDFQFVCEVIDDFLKENDKISYTQICMVLAGGYLGAGVAAERDPDYPHRSSRALTIAFWNLGNWCRKRFESLPLPTQLEKYRPYMDHKKDEFGKEIGDKTQYNNFFINVVKNMATHIFLNCEAITIYPHRERLSENGYTVCFNDWHDLMCAARVGRNGTVRQIAGYKEPEGDTKRRYVSWAIFEICFGETLDREGAVTPLARGRFEDVRVCIYHVDNNAISNSTAVTGEIIAHMAWECMMFQVDAIAGDGNKACYNLHPNKGGNYMPTYETSLIQFWIDRMIHTATQVRNQEFMPGMAPIRVKHFISASYEDLKFMDEKLKGKTIEAYTPELVKATEGKGDCCMMSIIEWGHSKQQLREDPSFFEDEDHMNFVGEFYFGVNETCMLADHQVFNLAPQDTDSHNLLLVHLNPSDMGHRETKSFKSDESKMNKAQRRKERQDINRKRGREQDQGGQGWYQQSWQGRWNQGGSSSSSSWWQRR